MTALLFTVSLPYLRAHAGRILLTLIGVIIGVQGMVAMGALNHSIIKSFEAGLEAIAGTARLQIAGPETGIPDSLAEEALRVPGVESAVAIIDGSLTLPDDASFRIRTFGIDLLGMVGTRSPQFPREHVHIPDDIRFVNAVDSIALGQPLLDRLHLKVGDTVRLATPGGIRPYVIRGWLDNVGPTKLFGGLVALLDLPTAESVFLSPGLAQTIYVSTKAEADVDTVARDLRSAIGNRARVERTEARGQQMDALLGSIRVALSLASLVTMIAAFFIIYETIAISVEQRKRDIAIARSLGFTRGAVAGVFMMESLILGVLGAAGGVLGGYLLARLSLLTAMAGVSGMYFTVTSGSVSLPAATTFAAAAIGTCVCVFAGLIPALTAATDPPAKVLRSTVGVADQTNPKRDSTIGILCIAAAVLIFNVDPSFSSVTAKTAWIMLAFACLLAGFALMSTAYVGLCNRLVTASAPHSPLTASLACDFFTRRPKRVAGSAAAIMVGYGLVVVLGSVVLSIEGTLRHWLEATFGAEISVGTSPGLNSALFDSSLATPLSRIAGVQSVERYQKSVLIFENRPVLLVGFDYQNRPDKNPLLIQRSVPNAYEAALRTDGAFVSESFAQRYRRDIGSVITLNTPQGQRDFKVLGVVSDYAMDLGTILVPYDRYATTWRDNKLTYAHLWTREGADLEEIRSRANDIVSNNPSVSVVTNAEFRAEVESRVRNLLSVLSSLQIFACAIAVLGVINFLLAATIDRRREIALLRSIGLTVSQVRLATMIEGGLVGLTGAVLGLLAGIPGSYFMVKHSMLVAMGWSLDFRFPVALATSTILAITVVATLASYFPARRITRGTILTGLQVE